MNKKLVAALLMAFVVCVTAPEPTFVTPRPGLKAWPEVIGWQVLSAIRRIDSEVEYPKFEFIRVNYASEPPEPIIMKPLIKGVVRMYVHSRYLHVVQPAPEMLLQRDSTNGGARVVSSGLVLVSLVSSC